MSHQPIAIHQFSPSLGYGDAISNYVIVLQKWLRSWGYSSDTYVIHADPRVAKHCQHYTAYKPQPHDVLVYHYGTASDLTPFLLNWPDQLSLIYHNITPHHFFEYEDSKLFKILKQAREELQGLKVARYAVGDSSYNCQELQKIDFPEAEPLPYLLNLENLDKYSGTEAEQKVLQQLDDNYINLLFVGRLAPNKRQDALIRFLVYYQKLVQPRTRLLLVGSGTPRYRAFLEIMAEKLGVKQDVHFLGHTELRDGFSAYYKGASVFLSMSEHEGFGVPLLESMYFDLPVIAYSTTAIPETMGGAGILVHQKRFDIFGELINLVTTDESFRTRIIRKQQERLQDFKQADLKRMFRNWTIKLQEKFG